MSEGVDAQRHGLFLTPLMAGPRLRIDAVAIDAWSGRPRRRAGQRNDEGLPRTGGGARTDGVAAMTNPQRVAVCVITYKRPVGLRRLLEGLHALTFRGTAPAVRCIVVDNDPEGSARAVVEAVQTGFRWGLEFVLEPARGIPFARNAALRQALPDAEWIAFIDDDEEPRPDWLDELLRVAHEHAADVVAGRVDPRFESPAPDWVVRGGFFTRRSHSTGGRLDRAATNNVVFRADILKSLDPWFDERRALTGGTDTHFFRRAHRAGSRIVWANEAVVTEVVPDSRVNAGWIRRRGFRCGAGATRTELDLFGRGGGAALALAAGAFFLLRGSLFALPAAWVRGRAGWVKHVYFVYYGAGRLCGLVGGAYEEYRTVHGR